jgi:endonuclease/exonuclease/phosphatase (EEP) superfamily protein YafD
MLMVTATALPLIESDEWWIRVLDFPRLQIAGILLLSVLAYWATRPRGRTAVMISAASVVALGWQGWTIVPYTSAWPQQMIAAKSCDQQRRVRFLIANVLQENRDPRLLLSVVGETDPDLILLTEIDEWWADQVAVLERTHPDTILEPLSNTYGIGLYSRLRLTNPDVRYLLEDHIPSILTRVTLASGEEFLMWGVHPAPPRPNDDTDERDAELLVVAKEAADANAPAIVAGDLNDVAWSSTTTLFQEVSGLLDPRIGRGLYSTFNADWPLMKWPLDHLFASDEWTLGEFRRLGDIGSDHYPILVELCFQPQSAAVQEGDAPDPGDIEEADEHIDEGREAAGEE